MKKLLFLVLMISCSLIAMDEPPRLAKLKERESGSNNSSSGSDSQASAFDNVELHRHGSPTLDTARLEQEGKIVIRNEQDIQKYAAELQKRGIVIDSKTEKGRPASIVYMPELSAIPTLNMAAIVRDKPNQGKRTPDLEKGSSNQSNQGEPDFEKAFEYCLKYLKEKKDMDISQVKNRMIEKFKKAHNTPPDSPKSSRQKTKKVVQALHDASQYHETARTKRTQEIQRNPVLQSAREPRALEVINALIKDPEVHSGLEAMEQIAFKLLSKKLTETQDSKTKTTWVTASIGALASIIAAGLTYLGTKHSC